MAARREAKSSLSVSVGGRAVVRGVRGSRPWMTEKGEEPVEEETAELYAPAYGAGHVGPPGVTGGGSEGAESARVCAVRGVVRVMKNTEAKGLILGDAEAGADVEQAVVLADEGRALGDGVQWVVGVGGSDFVQERGVRDEGGCGEGVERGGGRGRVVRAAGQGVGTVHGARAVLDVHQGGEGGELLQPTAKTASERALLEEGLEGLVVGVNSEGAVVEVVAPGVDGMDDGEQLLLAGGVVGFVGVVFT